MQKRNRKDLVTVEGVAGLFTGWLVGEDGWMVLDSFNLRDDHTPGQVMQQAGCPEVDETYTKPFTGKYQELAEDSLNSLLQVLLAELTEANGGEEPLLMLSDEPLWIQAEFLENVLSFELRPPCGCPPTVK